LTAEGRKAAGDLVIGVVLRSHGARGHVKVRSLSGETAHFAALHEVRLCRGDRTATLRVEEVIAGAGDIVRIKLAGVDTPEAARELTGWEIRVDRKQAAPLAPGEYYLADLEGCRVVAPGGEVGTVAAVLNAGAGDLIEVRADDGRTFFVPFRDEFVGDVDVEGAVIRLTEDPAPREGGA
jgi:16S rRNA processing protein RimM